MNLQRTTIGTCILTALMLVAGGGFAQTGDLAGAADAAGGLAGSYDVDASGAYDAAADTATDGHADLTSSYGDAMTATDKAEQELRSRSETQAEPDLPEPDVPVDAINTVDASHSDSLAKSLDAETGLVDANADVSAWGNVKAFFSGIADVAGGVMDGVKGMLGHDYETQAETDDAVNAVFDAKSDLRSEVDGIAHSDADLPEMEPRVSGDHSLEHSGELTSDAAGAVQLP